MIRIVPVSDPVQALHVIPAMSIAQHCQVALNHVTQFESRNPPNQLAAMSESSRCRPREPPGTPRTLVRTLISVLEVQVLELKAEVASQKRTIDLLSSVVIASNERVKGVMQKLQLDNDLPGDDLSGVLST